jgi:zinc transport system substrate-binding protein
MFGKKLGITILALTLGTAALTGCGSSSKAADSDKKFRVVCTIFPEYDWTREILGSHADSAELTYLLDNGVDLHSYQPTAEDMMKISTCDLFIYVGGESDEWVEDALEDAQNKNMRAIDLMDVLGDSVKEEELKEGMQGEEEEGEEEEEEYDEHVWLSLSNAKIICTEIEKNIEAIDPDNASDYKANLGSYIEKLDALDGEFKAVADSAEVKTLIFADRFPFRYLVDDYGLDYYAAFIGCSAETEASFETISFLAQKVNELGCDTIYTLESSDKSIAETVTSTSGADITIAELNSLQSVSQDDIAGGASYLSLMQKNCDVLEETLK